MIAHLYDSHEKRAWRMTCAAARYWWLTDHHGGQASETYRQLCTIGEAYRPGCGEVSVASLDGHRPDDQGELQERWDELEIYTHYCHAEGCCQFSDVVKGDKS